MRFNYEYKLGAFIVREIKLRAWDGKRIVSSDNFWLSADGHAAIFNDSGNIEYAHWELMQFTGLLDKNGVEIYEGDIIYVNQSGNCKVVFDDESLCWMVEWDKCVKGEGCYLYVNEDNHRVIGNIYENPELLEQNNES